MLKKFGSILITGILVASMFSCSDISENSEIKTEKNVVKVSDKVATYSYIGEYQATALKEALKNSSRSAEFFVESDNEDYDDTDDIVESLLSDSLITENVAKYINRVNEILENDDYDVFTIKTLITEVENDAVENLSETDSVVFMSYAETAKADYEVAVELYGDCNSARFSFKKLVKKAKKVAVAAAIGAVKEVGKTIIKGQVSIETIAAAAAKGAVEGAITEILRS